MSNPKTSSTSTKPWRLNLKPSFGTKPRSTVSVESLFSKHVLLNYTVPLGYAFTNHSTTIVGGQQGGQLFLG